MVLVWPVLAGAESAAVEESKTIDGEAVEHRYHHSEWVSLVKVESVQSLINPTLSSYSGMTAVQGYSYSVSVVQDWKSGEKDPVKLRVDLSDCPLLLAIDNEYLVFARQNYRGGLQVSSCKDMVHRNDISAVLPVLEALKQSHLSAMAKSS